MKVTRCGLPCKTVFLIIVGSELRITNGGNYEWEASSLELALDMEEESFLAFSIEAVFKTQHDVIGTYDIES